jgi:hypothetical protein
MSYHRRKRLILTWGTLKKEGQTEPDWLYRYPAKKIDARILHGFVEGSYTFPEFIEKLKNRGYDTSTLRLEVGMPEAVLDEYQFGIRK